MSEANFNLRICAFNNHCLQAIEKGEQVKNENGVVTVLVLHLNKADHLSFMHNKIDFTENFTVTNRMILQCFSKILNP